MDYKKSGHEGGSGCNDDIGGNIGFPCGVSDGGINIIRLRILPREN